MLWLALAWTAAAHPGADLHTAQDCADLPGIFLRVEGLVEEGRTAEAHADVDLAATCAADPALLALARGTILLAERRFADALAALDQAVALAPAPPAWLARAQALEQLGRHGDAAQDRLAALDASDAPSPDLYVAAATALAAAGRRAEALAVVDRGLADRGAVTALVVAGVHLAEPADALRRLDALPDTAANLQLRAEVLLAGGRRADAKAALADALEKARAARPSPHRTRQIAALEAALATLEAP